MPRQLQELHLSVRGAVEALTAVAGRAPTVDELAAHLGVARDDVMLALDARFAYRARSLDAADADGNTSGTARRLGALDDAIEDAGDRTEMRQALLTMTPRHRAILVMTYFEERTQAESGTALGISQVHVSRLLRSALASMRISGLHAPSELQDHEPAAQV